MKTVRAVAPYTHPGFLNFKTAPYEAWKKLGGQTAKAHYPSKAFHRLAFQHELPTLWKNKKEARLRFVEPVSISFDSFPDYARYEIIPFVWDFWPRYFEKMCQWLKRHQVQTAIFTSSQTTERMQQRFPTMNIMYCPEAVDTTLYQEGTPLKDREIDLLEFGRGSHLNVNLNGNGDENENDNGNENENDNENENENDNGNENENENGRLHYVCTKVNGKFTYTNKQLYKVMGNAKVTIALPRNLTQPKVAGDIETLTQRYWECMLSRMVMLGHAPKELTNLIGYNPVIELDKDHANEQILDILAHINDYQELVDKNRETALSIGNWSLRMRDVMEWLQKCGYEI